MKLLSRIVSSILFAFIVLVSGLWLTELQRQHNYLAKHGETVQATVTHVQVSTTTKERNGKNRTSRKVRPTLTFVNSVGQEQQIVYTGQGLSSDIAVGDVKTLQYLPENPGMHVMMDFGPRWLIRIITGIGLLVGLLGLRYAIWGKTWSWQYDASLSSSPYHPLVGFFFFGIAAALFGFGFHHFNQENIMIQKGGTRTEGVITGFQPPAGGTGRYAMDVRYLNTNGRTATASLGGDRQPLLSMNGDHPYPEMGNPVKLLLPADGSTPYVAVVFDREFPLLLVGLGLCAVGFLVSSLSYLYFWIWGK